MLRSSVLRRSIQTTSKPGCQQNPKGSAAHQLPLPFLFVREFMITVKLSMSLTDQNGQTASSNLAVTIQDRVFTDEILNARNLLDEFICGLSANTSGIDVEGV